MTYELPELPYGINDLAPHISAETLEFHHGKHHNAYVGKLNELLDGDSSKSLEELIRVQPSRSSMEPHLLLELHVGNRRWRTKRRTG